MAIWQGFGLGGRDDLAPAPRHTATPYANQGSPVTSAGALARGLLMAVLVIAPYAILPLGGAEPRPLVVLAALVMAVLTVSEYRTPSPTLIEFRDARPYNRIRLAGLSAGVLGAAVLLSDAEGLSSLGQLIHAIGERVGQALDVPGSPVALVGSMIPSGADPAYASGVRGAAALSYLASGAMVGAFYLSLWHGRWPQSGGFNVWVNLPHFDPTAGGDVVERLTRGAQTNLALGFFLPFAIPMAALALGGPTTLGEVRDPIPLAWMLAIWAFAPASLVMRGMALNRIVRSIAAQRARQGHVSTPHAESERLRAA